MPYQTNFSPHQQMDITLPGMAPDYGKDMTGAAVEIIKPGYGLFNVAPATEMTRGGRFKVVMAGGAGASQFVGVAMHNNSLFTNNTPSFMGDQTNNDGGDYPITSPVPYRQQGPIWVPVNMAVDPTSSVHLIIAGVDRGKFRANATGFTTLDLSTRARWEWTTQSTKYNGQLAFLYLIGN